MVNHTGMSDRTTTTARACQRGWLGALFVVALVAVDPAAGQDALDCGSLDNPYGPFDYTDAVMRAEKLPRVEKAHFDSGVRALKGHGRKVFTWANLAGDIAYTLKVFPNHHQALYTMAQYHLQGYDKNQPMLYTPNCWFERAHRMAPRDGNVWLIEGIYQARMEQYDAARESYQRAIELMPNAPEAHYNLGLLYVETGDYELAREHAEKAYALGYPMPGLKSKLARLGEWE